MLSRQVLDIGSELGSRLECDAPAAQQGECALGGNAMVDPERIVWPRNRIARHKPPQNSFQRSPRMSDSMVTGKRSTFKSTKAAVSKPPKPLPKAAKLVG